MFRYRNPLIAVGIAAALSILACYAIAQPPGRRGPGGPRRPGGPSGPVGPGGSILDLVENAAVQAELKIKDAQKTKIQTLAETVNQRRRQLRDQMDPRGQQGQGQGPVWERTTESQQRQRRCQVGRWGRMAAARTAVAPAGRPGWPRRWRWVRRIWPGGCGGWGRRIRWVRPGGFGGFGQGGFGGFGRVDTADCGGFGGLVWVGPVAGPGGGPGGQGVEATAAKTRDGRAPSRRCGAETTARSRRPSRAWPRSSITDSTAASSRSSSSWKASRRCSGPT